MWTTAGQHISVLTDITALRAEIPALARTVYLNTAGYAPPPRRVVEATVDAYRFLQENGPDVAAVRQKVRDQAEAARASLAGLLGVTPEEIAFTRSVSEGINIVAWGLTWQPGDEVIITDQEHPSGRVPWLNLRDRFGVKVLTIPLDRDGDGVLDRLREAVTPRTRLIAMSHVTAESGLRLPAQQICELAHEDGLRVLFDAAQAVGQFSIDLRAIGADYYAMTGHKWLLGGFGVGALYVRRELLDEVAVSWTGAGATQASRPPNDELTWMHDARRYEFGGRLWPAYVGYGVAVTMVRDIGLDMIEARVAPMAAALKAELATIPGVTVLSPPDRSRATGIATFEIDGMPGDAVASVLWARWQIVCRAARAFGRSATRLSAAFFTTQDELSLACDAVRQLAREAQPARSARS